ncbi:MAG: sigma-70 family RNA polymerase sigma factor [Solirubrobacteraceae bacterium]|jgi:RNA polymerase sigma factor (sigma-70 family)
MPVSDERLIEACRNGSQAAFDEIVGRYHDLLVRHCSRIVGEANAHDAVQDALLTAWTALRGGTEVRALRPWLFTIAHHRALAVRRDRHSNWSELSESLSDGSSSADAAASAQRVRDALAALAALPIDQREALMFSAVHGRSGREIARALGVEEPVVRQLVHRARAHVRAAAAACLVPPILLGRWARNATASLRRLALSSQAAPAYATAKVVKIGVTVLGAALAGTAAVPLARALQHRQTSGHASIVKPLAALSDQPAIRHVAARHDQTSKGALPTGVASGSGSAPGAGQSRAAGGGPQRQLTGAKTPTTPVSPPSPNILQSAVTGNSGVPAPPASSGALAAATGSVGAVTSTVTNLASAVTPAVTSTITAGVTSATGTITAGVKPVTGTITAGVTPAVTTVTHAAGPAAESVTTGVTGLIGAVTGG